MSQLGQHIATRRQALGMTKTDLSRQAGVSDVAIHYWESSEIKQIGHERLLSLAAALDCTVSELLEDPGLNQLKRQWQAEALKAHAKKIATLHGSEEMLPAEVVHDVLIDEANRLCPQDEEEGS